MKKLLAILLVTLMVVTVFAGCGGGSSSSGSSGGSSGIVESDWPSGYPYQEGAFKDQKITLWTGQRRSDDPESAWVEFETATGGRVETVPLNSSDGLAPLVTAITAGNDIDIVAFDERQFPSWVIKNLVIPVSDIIDFETDEIVKNSPNQPIKSVSDFYTLDGKLYAFNNSPVMSTSYIIYRKSMIEQAGLDDPYELWQEGNWNFDTIRDMCAELTYDSDDDGIVDKYAIAGYMSKYVIGCVGGDANVVRYDENGEPQFALDDPDIIEALEFYRELQQKGYNTTYITPEADFVSGNAAMMVGIIGWSASLIADEIGLDDIGYVPFPASPSNTSGVSNTMIYSGSYAFSSAVKNKELLKEWVRFSFFWNDEEDREKTIQNAIDTTWAGSREWFEFDQSLLENAWICNSQSFGLLDDLCNEHLFWKSEESILNCLTSLAPAAQAEINSVFNDMSDAQ